MSVAAFIAREKVAEGDALGATARRVVGGAGRAHRRNRRRRRGRRLGDDEIDEVVAVRVGGRREGARPVGEDAVAAHHGADGAGDDLGGQAARGERVEVVAVDGDDVGLTGGQGEGARELRGLPAARALADEGDLGELRAAGAPDAADVRAGLAGALEEADRADLRRRRRGHLHAHLVGEGSRAGAAVRHRVPVGLRGRCVREELARDDGRLGREAPGDRVGERDAVRGPRGGGDLRRVALGRIQVGRGVDGEVVRVGVVGHGRGQRRSAVRPDRHRRVGQGRRVHRTRERGGRRGADGDVVGVVGRGRAGHRRRTRRRRDLGRRHHEVHQVAAVVPGGGREGAGRVCEDAIRADDGAHGARRDLRREAGGGDRVEVVAVDGDDVGLAGRERQRGHQLLGLPAGGGLTGEGDLGQLGAALGPDAADVRAALTGALVEAHRADLGSEGRLDLDARLVGEGPGAGTAVLHRVTVRDGRSGVGVELAGAAGGSRRGGEAPDDRGGQGHAGRWRSRPSRSGRCSRGSA